MTSVNTGDVIGSSQDGKVLALPRYNQGALLWSRDRPGGPMPLGPQGDVRSCAVSPDGRWVATGSHSLTRVFVKVARSFPKRDELNFVISGFSGVAGSRRICPAWPLA